MRISITFDDETYKQLKNIASRNNISIAETVRGYTCEMLNGQVSRYNVDLISRILRQELQAVLGRYFERLIALQAKTCVQAGTAAYLSAEALSSFVPNQLQRDFVEAYEAARKKAVQYTRQHNTDE